MPGLMILSHKVYQILELNASVGANNNKVIQQ